MKKLTAYFGYTLLALMLVGCGEKEPVTLYDLDDKPINISAENSMWHIINYWADWCTPCLTEIPALNAFEAAHSDQIKVIGVHADSLSVADLKQLVQKLDIQFSVLKQDPRYQLGLKPLHVLPTTYVINPEGNVLGPFHGAQSEASLNQIMSLKNNKAG